jgi:hypothetical protein
MTKQIAAVMAAVLLALPTTGAERPAHARKIPCKTEAIAASCYWAHGRLQYGNGTPSLRLWKTGTNRLLGIFSGPSVNTRFDDKGDNENPELPENVSKYLRLAQSRIWADFEICPLEPEHTGVMQSACIEAAKNVFVEKFD